MSQVYSLEHGYRNDEEPSRSNTGLDNENDLLYSVAARVKVLADQPMWMIRKIADVGREDKRTRGELIEAIVTDEFHAEFPRQFVEE